MKKCKLEGCDNKSRRNGFCVNHDYHYKKGNISYDGEWLKEINLRIHQNNCKVKGCNNDSEVGGYCLSCYKGFVLGNTDKFGKIIKREKKDNKKWIDFQNTIKNNDKQICLGDKEYEEIIVVGKKHKKKVEINYDGCCKVRECGARARYKIGFCSNHYYHYQNKNIDINGNWLKKVKLWTNGECKISNCKEEYFAKGYCKKHYKQIKKGIIIDSEIDLGDYKKCKVEDCEKLVDSHGFCGAHAYHFKVGNLDKNGNWIKEPKRKRNTVKFKECIVDGCAGKVLAKGLCQKHYSSMIRLKNIEWLKNRYFDGGNFLCKDCGNEFEFFQMDFHHIDGKEFSIGEQLSNSRLTKRQDIVGELDNGIWLCSRCHLKRHYDPELTFYETKGDKKRAKSIDLAYREIIERRGCNCDVCGDVLSPRELEFHHRSSEEKEDRISQMVGWYNIDNIMKEIDKCDIVCRNCHKLIHYASNEFAGMDYNFFNNLLNINNIKI